MRVVVVGAGNVATVLGRLIKQAGHEILQVLSREETNAKTLGTELGCSFTANCKEINKTADIYLIAVTDTAMAQLDETIHLGNKLIVHTAGSLPKEALQKFSTNYGVLYPLQSLRKENMHPVQDIPLLTDANNEQALNMLNAFAKTISGSVTPVGDEQRQKLHVAAVFVSNFTNQLYNLAATFCNKEGIDFTLLQPLIEETALRLRNHVPGEMKTGPAVRKDIQTLHKHLLLLAPYPPLHNIYLKMTESIMNG